VIRCGKITGEGIETIGKCLEKFKALESINLAFEE